MEQSTASEELVTHIAQALPKHPERVFHLDTPAGPVIVKRAAPHARGRLLNLIAGWFSRLISGRKPSMAALRLAGDRQQIQHEAGRLRDLKAAGVAVPEVLALDDQWLAISYVGETVHAHMPQLNLNEQSLLLCDLVRDLARFHNRGLWHGASQLRNLTLWQGRYYRIDFEEDLAGNLPLQILQTYDLLLFLGSCIARYGRSREWDIALVEQLLLHYRLINPNPQIETYLRRINRVISPLAWLVSPVSPWLGRDVRRLVLLSGGLSNHFKTRSRLKLLIPLAILCALLLANYD